MVVFADAVQLLPPPCLSLVFMIIPHGAGLRRWLGGYRRLISLQKSAVPSTYFGQLASIGISSSRGTRWPLLASYACVCAYTLNKTNSFLITQIGFTVLERALYYNLSIVPSSLVYLD